MPRRQAGLATTGLQRRRYTDVAFDEGAVRNGAAADNWLRSTCSVTGWPLLEGARVQHVVAPLEDAGRQYRGSKGLLHFPIDSTGPQG